jgi:organic hydroperoxide reductase OsmC/OhrA
MSEKQHHYRPVVTWTGNTGTGTSGYRTYERAHRISAPGKTDILGSSDPTFRGDASGWNPEDLLVASVSACHMLWYLHLCAVGGIIVLEYRDEPEGVMIENADGSGRFASIVLHPAIRLAPGSDKAKALALHGEAHAKCFIANSVNFPIAAEPAIVA